MATPAQPPDRSPQEELSNACASQSIDLQFWQWPEFRLELVNGQFLVGGTLEGSRWLLKEALIGWGLEAAIAFAPLEQWWEALRQAHDISCRSQEEWLLWADALPLSSNYKDEIYPPLGSQYAGEHRWIRDYLWQALSLAIGKGGWGRCFGPNYGMQLAQDVLTPDILLLSTRQLAQDVVYSYYTEAVAHLVIEITYPEQDAVDRETRRSLYEQAQVQHYWIVDPQKQQFEFWQWSPEGYQLRELDPDGCYRGVGDMSFSPEIFWLNMEENQSPYTQKLPAFTTVAQSREWEFRKEPSTEIGYGSVPFLPSVGLTPQPITPEQFISWCPETKLEGGPFPLIGGGEIGTRNAIALLLMSLGLVETVKLMSGYEWVRVLRRLTREAAQDNERKAQWWKQARELARQLVEEHRVGGVGVIGALLSEQPLNRWSQIHLVLWDIPDEFKKWSFMQTLPDDIPVELTEAVWALPGEWQEIADRMEVLAGTGKPHGPRPQERMVFHWIESES
ncbi:MAG: Uma2 family endonuclease [Cyanobacteria bacterium P01_D01_bin.1]